MYFEEPESSLPCSQQSVTGLQLVSDSSIRHMHIILGYKLYKNPRLVTRGASFAPRTQNIEAPLYIIYLPGGGTWHPGFVYLCHILHFIISIVPNKCMFPLGFPT